LAGESVFPTKAQIETSYDRRPVTHADENAPLEVVDSTTTPFILFT
jgi:hypothetical protein